MVAARAVDSLDRDTPTQIAAPLPADTGTLALEDAPTVLRGDDEKR